MTSKGATAPGEPSIFLAAPDKIAVSNVILESNIFVTNQNNNIDNIDDSNANLQTNNIIRHKRKLHQKQPSPAKQFIEVMRRLAHAPSPITSYAHFSQIFSAAMPNQMAPADLSQCCKHLQDQVHEVEWAIWSLFALYTQYCTNGSSQNQNQQLGVRLSFLRWIQGKLSRNEDIAMGEAGEAGRLWSWLLKHKALRIYIDEDTCALSTTTRLKRPKKQPSMAENDNDPGVEDGNGCGGPNRQQQELIRCHLDALADNIRSHDALRRRILSPSALAQLHSLGTQLQAALEDPPYDYGFYEEGMRVFKARYSDALERHPGIQPPTTRTTPSSSADSSKETNNVGGAASFASSSPSPNSAALSSIGRRSNGFKRASDMPEL